MRACIVGRITVHDPAKWRRYVAAVPATLAPFAGEVVLRGERRRALAGDDDRERIVVIRFPDLAAVESWYRSDAYQSLVPLRDEAADVTITAYET